MLQPFLSNSFTSLAAIPYFRLSCRLLILKGLLFPKSPNIWLCICASFWSASIRILANLFSSHSDTSDIRRSRLYTDLYVTAAAMLYVATFCTQNQIWPLTFRYLNLLTLWLILWKYFEYWTTPSNSLLIVSIGELIYSTSLERNWVIKAKC